MTHVHYDASYNVHCADSYSIQSESDFNSDSADFAADSSAVDSDSDSESIEFEHGDDVQSWVVAGPATDDIDAYDMAARADARYFTAFGITPGGFFEVGLYLKLLF
ncbi:hypothetical protein AURDEDRAFT_160508 [Auricularia subglabra TFB-10046 SS5]|nr:hypothetical protein AURDEDRAFT_160508 [Auricularia subglabra TFB-10046 SS5]